jgi:N-acetylmuramoyl-L-alanine amidase
MKHLPIVLLAAWLPVTAALGAQRTPEWRVDTPGRSGTVSTVVGPNLEALPASVLVTLGAEIAYVRGGIDVALGQHRVELRLGDSTVTVDGQRRLHPGAVLEQDGMIFIPTWFFNDVLRPLSGGTLVVDYEGRVLFGTLPRPGAEVLAAAPPPPPPPAAAAPPDSTPAETAPPTRRLVVIDAGHGGRDPGAHGPGGTREKDVALRVARELAAILREDPTLDVRMTRDRDTLIALHDRARLANRWRAEGQPAVFISIHCNANESRSERGFETYFLAEARTADARRVEAFENAATQYEETAPPGGALGFILTDLRQNQYLRESSGWAQLVQDRLRAIHPGPNRGVKQAGFAVLRGTFMPAVLVEIGFVTHPTEERLLGREDMQEDVARQLSRSIRDFFARPQPTVAQSGTP